jgi:bifunctional UDP-N-acetylglucosamine pyrophosphorylase/glucosamine-1-phosphate N-acetyltransferase
VQDKQLGTAHALLSAKHRITGENILVLYGDHPLIKAKSLKALMALHHKKSSNITMFTTTVPNFTGSNKAFEHFGRIVRDSHKRINKIVEYKDASAGQKKIKELNSGIYMFNTAWLWEHAKKIGNSNKQAEYYLTDIVEVAIAHGEQIQSLAIDSGEVVGINSPQDLKLAEALV